MGKENGFNKLRLLNLKDYTEEIIHKLMQLLAELIRREKATMGFLKNLCSVSIETRIWWILFEAGSAQPFTYIFRVAECSRWKLNDTLQELLSKGLIRMVGKDYQALSPDWFHVKFNN